MADDSNSNDQSAEDLDSRGSKSEVAADDEIVVLSSELKSVTVLETPEIFVEEDAISTPSIRNPLDELNDEELTAAVEGLKRNTHYLRLENEVFSKFLRNNEPSLLGGMDETLQMAMEVHERSFSSGTGGPRGSSLIRRDSRMWKRSSFIQETNPDKVGPRVNINQRSNLVVREVDQIHETMQVLRAKARRTKRRLKTHLDEMDIRARDIRDTIELFEGAFIYGTIDKYPQKNPAERFIRYMEEWLKNNTLTMDKIRLRTSTLKVLYSQTCNQLTHKKQLGENLHKVDFEQLHIENRHLAKNIEQRNLLLLEMKKLSGSANLLLSTHKKNLIRRMEDVKQIQFEIKLNQQGIQKLDEEYDKVNIDLQKARNEFDELKDKMENYRVPDILEYVRKKAELGVLRKSLKKWYRRKHLKDMALAASLREIKAMTGSRTVKDKWLELPQGLSGDSSTSLNFKFLCEANQVGRPRKSIRAKREMFDDM